MPVPNIAIGQVAIDPTNKVFYFKKLNGELVSSTLDFLQDGFESIVTSDNVTISGDLTVNGTTTTLNVETVLIEDNILVLNSNVTGSPTINAGLEVERGTSSNVQIRWNEDTDKWQFTNDGTTYYDISSIIANSVELGLHTTGDYIKSLVAGVGITLVNNSGESATPTISIGQDVSTTSSVIFANVTSNLTGNVSGTVSDISNHGINDLSDVTLNSPANGDFLRYNGLNWINDPVNLTTDTVGDYVATVQAGTGISITNASGEGATPIITLNANIDSLTDIQITSAANGQTLLYDGTNWVNTTFPSSEPIGHENKADSVISFDESTRQFSIAPVSTSYTVWCKGKRYVKTGTETVTIPDTSGLYYIYFNSSGSLAYKTTFFTWDEDTPTAYIYWNDVDNKAYFFADERHGVTLDWATHEYLHRTRGAAIASGFGANNYTTAGDGSDNSHVKIDIANGTFFDEDLQVDIEHSASPTANTWQQRLQSGAYIPVFYRLNNHWKKDVATQYPIKFGSALQSYNLNTAGTWSTPDINNNQFGITWIVATNNLNEPIIAILGQAQYTNVGAAEAVDFSSLDLSGFPVFEFRPLYKFIYDTSNSYSNTPKARLASLVDIRSTISGGTGAAAVAVSDHGNLTGLSDDDHTQYFNSARHDAHDHSAALNSAALNDLGDVTITSPSSNQGLIWNGSAWVNQNIPLDIDGLSDVVITSATPNQILKFDGYNWVNATAPSGTILGTTYLTTIGNGSSNSFVLNHGLSTRDIVVTFTETASPYGSFLTTWEATDLNNITVYFENPPALNSVRVSIFASVSGSTLNVNSINDIGDVTITSATPGQVLSWDGSNWVNSVVSGGGGGSVNSYAETIGDNMNMFYTITHNLGTRDIILQARNVNSPYEYYNIGWEATTVNTATVYFDSPPTTNSVRIKIVA